MVNCLQNFFQVHHWLRWWEFCHTFLFLARATIRNRPISFKVMLKLNEEQWPLIEINCCEHYRGNVNSAIQETSTIFVVADLR